MVANRGANSVFQITPDGVILVNTKAEGEDNFERLAAYIRGLTDQPVKFVFNTRNDPDYNGNNARFEAAGARVVNSDVKLGPAEARIVRAGESVAVLLSSAKVLVADDLAANREGILKLDWAVAVPARGASVHRSEVESSK
jgi:glyoxylase-like metal-dependent hydrolase (beta-lactamase superfamily II)